MSKYSKSILIIVMIVIGMILILYANQFNTWSNTRMFSYYYSGWNPQARHHLDPYLVERLKDLWKFQLMVLNNLVILFNTLGLILIISGVIYSFIVEKEVENRE